MKTIFASKFRASASRIPVAKLLEILIVISRTDGSGAPMNFPLGRLFSPAGGLQVRRRDITRSANIRNDGRG